MEFVEFAAKNNIKHYFSIKTFNWNEAFFLKPMFRKIFRKQFPVDLMARYNNTKNIDRRENNAVVIYSLLGSINP